MSGDKLWVQLEGSTSLVFVRTGEDVFVDDKAVVTVHAIKLALKKEMPRKLDPIALQDMSLSFNKVVFDDDVHVRDILSHPQSISGNAGRKSSPFLLCITPKTASPHVRFALPESEEANAMAVGKDNYQPASADSFRISSAILSLAQLANNGETNEFLDFLHSLFTRASSRFGGLSEKTVTLKTPAIEATLCEHDAVKGVESDVSCAVEHALLEVVSTVYAESFEDPQFHSLVLQRDAPKKLVFVRIGCGIGVTLRVTWRGYLAIDVPASPFFISHANSSICGSVSSVDTSLTPTMLRVSFQRRRFRRGASSLHHGEVLTALRPITMWQGDRRRTDAFLKLYTVERASNVAAQAVDRLYHLDMKLRQIPQLPSVEGFAPGDVWYTTFQIALVSPFVGERDATSQDLVQPTTARAVAATLLEMAKLGLLFSSLELGHIRVAADGSRPTLVGLDHCEILEAPVQSARDLLSLLGGSRVSQFLVEHGGVADALGELS